MLDKTTRTPKQSNNRNDSTVFEDLKYGSSLTLNINTGSSKKKFTTNSRVSDKVIATMKDSDACNVNGWFKILPSSQYLMQEKIIDIIEEQQIPSNIEIEYENFLSESNSNTSAYNIKKGT